jgi:hypothetical protein
MELRVLINNIETAEQTMSAPNSAYSACPSNFIFFSIPEEVS